MADESKGLGMGCIVPIVVAIIGLMGVIFTAVITNIDKIIGTPTPQPNVVVTATPVPAVSQPDEPASNPSTESSPKSSRNKTAAQMIGFWNVTFAKLKFDVTFINGGLFEMSVEDYPAGSGEWSYSAGVLTTRANNGVETRGSVKWINDDAFEVTVTDSSDSPMMIGQKYHYKRMKDD